MVYYDVGLGKNGVTELDKAFGEFPYILKNPKGVSHHTVSVYVKDKQIEFLAYDSSKVIFYRPQIKEFSEELKKDIVDVLNQLDSTKWLSDKVKSYINC